MGKSEEDSIKEKKQEAEKKKKKILMIFLLVFIIFCFMEGYLSMKNTKKTEEKTKKAQQEQSYDNKDIENVIGKALNNGTTQTEEITEDDQPEKIEDGSEISAVSSVEIKDLNEEVLNFIDNDKAGLEKAIREWMNGYGLAEMKSVSFYGECLIDYNKKTVAVSFVVDMDSSPGFDAVYNRELKSFSIVTW